MYSYWIARDLPIPIHLLLKRYFIRIPRKCCRWSVATTIAITTISITIAIVSRRHINSILNRNVQHGRPADNGRNGRFHQFLQHRILASLGHDFLSTRLSLLLILSFFVSNFKGNRTLIERRNPQDLEQT